jgi:hypothetical protein
MSHHHIDIAQCVTRQPTLGQTEKLTRFCNKKIKRNWKYCQDLFSHPRYVKTFGAGGGLSYLAKHNVAAANNIFSGRKGICFSLSLSELQGQMVNLLKAEDLGIHWWDLALRLDLWSGNHCIKSYLPWKTNLNGRQHQNIDTVKSENTGSEVTKTNASNADNFLCINIKLRWPNHI